MRDEASDFADGDSAAKSARHRDENHDTCKFEGVNMKSVLNVKSVLCTLAAVAGLCVFAAKSDATTITDPIGDFLGTFRDGVPRNADLDVVSASATYGSNFVRLSTKLNGNVGTTKVDGVANGLYVWGVDRGGATAVLNQGLIPVGADVTFNAIVALFANGTGFVAQVNPNGTLASAPIPVTVTISGDTISADVLLTDLPSTGADISDYGFNVWSRIDGITSGDQVADFGPDAGRGDESTFEASAIPEPASWALMITGLGLFAATTLRRRRTLTA